MWHETKMALVVILGKVRFISLKTVRILLTACSFRMLPTGYSFSAVVQHVVHPAFVDHTSIAFFVNYLVDGGVVCGRRDVQKFLAFGHESFGEFV